MSCVIAFLICEMGIVAGDIPQQGSACKVLSSGSGPGKHPVSEGTNEKPRDLYEETVSGR